MSVEVGGVEGDCNGGVLYFGGDDELTSRVNSKSDPGEEATFRSTRAFSARGAGWGESLKEGSEPPNASAITWSGALGDTGWVALAWLSVDLLPVIEGLVVEGKVSGS